MNKMCILEQFAADVIFYFRISVVIMEDFWLKMWERLYKDPGCVFSENGACMLYKGTSRDRAGYARFRYNIPDICQKETSAHRMAKMLEQKSLDLGSNDASHLCHNKLCVYAPHLNLESSQTNNARRRCVHAGVCSRHPRGDGTYHPDCLLHLKL